MTWVRLVCWGNVDLAQADVLGQRSRVAGWCDGTKQNWRKLLCWGKVDLAQVCGGP